MQQQCLADCPKIRKRLTNPVCSMHSMNYRVRRPTYAKKNWTGRGAEGHFWDQELYVDFRAKSTRPWRRSRFHSTRYGSGLEASTKNWNAEENYNEYNWDRCVYIFKTIVPQHKLAPTPENQVKPRSKIGRWWPRAVKVFGLEKGRLSGPRKRSLGKFAPADANKCLRASYHRLRTRTAQAFLWNLRILLSFDGIHCWILQTIATHTCEDTLAKHSWWHSCGASPIGTAWEKCLAWHDLQWQSRGAPRVGTLVKLYGHWHPNRLFPYDTHTHKGLCGPFDICPMFGSKVPSQAQRTCERWHVPAFF